MFHNVSNRKADQVLPNGENAHATIKGSVWWERSLSFAFPDYWIDCLNYDPKEQATRYVMVKRYVE